MDMVDRMEKAAGHEARVVDIDGKVWQGHITGFTTALDNDGEDSPGVPYIDMWIDGASDGIRYELLENEIKSIEVLD